MTPLRLIPAAVALAATAAVAHPPAGKLRHHAAPARVAADPGCRAAPFVPAGKLRTYGRDPAPVRCAPVEIARAGKPVGGTERAR